MIYIIPEELKSNYSNISGRARIPHHFSEKLVSLYLPEFEKKSKAEKGITDRELNKKFSATILTVIALR